MNIFLPLEGATAGSSVVHEDFDGLQKTAARIPALSRLLQTNGFMTASGGVSKSFTENLVNGSAKVGMRATGAFTPTDDTGPNTTNAICM